MVAQKDLYLVSSELATLRGKVDRLKERVGPEHAAWAEGQTARYEKKIEIKDWVISGDSAVGAALDLAIQDLRTGPDQIRELGRLIATLQRCRQVS